MKSQTLESESPKTSKQKALLEMLSPLQCHSQVYDGTLDLLQTRQHCKLTKY